MNNDSRWNGSRWNEPRGSDARSNDTGRREAGGAEEPGWSETGWSESGWGGARPGEARSGDARRRGADPLEQRLDRWVSAGRQLVDGVSGARPGSRPAGRSGASRSGSLPRLDHLGRWMENKLDWLLEDGDDWREPWEAPEGSSPESRSAPPSGGAPRGSGRRPLEAISRRGRLGPAGERGSNRSMPPAATPPARVSPAAAAPDDAGEHWPSDDDFSLPRWQRPATAEGYAAPARSEAPAPGDAPAGRPLPRSSRRRRPA
ncbi:MAG: hypothetical protein ACOVNL_07165 [Prochlorococcaceae cyanobacterium]|jgi:hypothetical protein